MSLPKLPHPLPTPLVDVISERMALLGDPTRIRIIDALRYEEQNVQSKADLMMTTQQNVSGHLRLLRAAGTVSRRPAGREVFYAIADETVFEVWQRLLAAVEPRRG